jgi:hypothetical protein
LTGLTSIDGDLFEDVPAGFFSPKFALLTNQKLNFSNVTGEQNLNTAINDDDDSDISSPLYKTGKTNVSDVSNILSRRKDTNMSAISGWNDNRKYTNASTNSGYSDVGRDNGNKTSNLMIYGQGHIPNRLK